MTGSRIPLPVRAPLPAGVPLLVSLLLVALGAGSAQAAGYRYWSFWESDGGGWAYATEGPATARPADGSVTGFRFSVSADSGDAAKPRGVPDFTAVCGDTAAEAGRKRVAVVVDPGTAADAPDGERPPAPRATCARVGEDATAAEALAAVAEPLRYNADALLCAISGYPASGCGEQVRDGEKQPEETAPAAPPGTAPPTTPTTAGTTAGGSRDTAAPATGAEGDHGGGPSLGLVAGVAAVAALAAAGLWRARRRRG
ncbi:SCO2322 family protein [Streptomyces sp. NPDC095613]|uniref:SCO2322 family protein n=1 Tax=Streptomyces sp. NPDC095613 TaxID=3155540 RepID=UPI00331BF714